VARHRYALLAALCTLALGCLLPASGAIAGSGVAGVHLKKHHRHGRHHHRRHHRRRAHRARCSALAARLHRAHARKSSFQSGPARLHCRGYHVLHRGSGAARPGPAAANSSTCADADLTPTPEDLDRVRAATLCLVNRERAGHGEGALVENTRLDQAAQAHSKDMAEGDYFDHVSPSGVTPLSRMRSCGYIYSSRVGYEVGENIAWGTLWLATPRAIVAAWMNSPEHRANILNGHYRDTAIGVSPHPIASLANGQAGAIYTQDFGLIITA